jgi:hypothetical protein
MLFQPDEKLGTPAHPPKWNSTSEPMQSPPSPCLQTIIFPPSNSPTSHFPNASSPLSTPILPFVIHRSRSTARPDSRQGLELHHLVQSSQTKPSLARQTTPVARPAHSHLANSPPPPSPFHQHHRHPSILSSRRPSTKLISSKGASSTTINPIDGRPLSSLLRDTLSCDSPLTQLY